MIEINSTYAMNVIRPIVMHQDCIITTNLYMKELHLNAFIVTTRRKKNNT